MTVQLILECNAKAEQIGQSIALETVSTDPVKQERARRKLANMVDMQVDLTRDIVALFKEGITFDKWKALFLRMNSAENIKKVDNAQGELALVTRIAIEQGDLEAYYNQIVLGMSTEQITMMEEGIPSLIAFGQKIRDAADGK